MPWNDQIVSLIRVMNCMKNKNPESQEEFDPAARVARGLKVVSCYGPRTPYVPKPKNVCGRLESRSNGDRPIGMAGLQHAMNNCSGGLTHNYSPTAGSGNYKFNVKQELVHSK